MDFSFGCYPWLEILSTKFLEDSNHSSQPNSLVEITWTFISQPPRRFGGVFVSSGESFETPKIYENLLLLLELPPHQPTWERPKPQPNKKSVMDLPVCHRFSRKLKFPMGFCCHIFSYLAGWFVGGLFLW